MTLTTDLKDMVTPRCSIRVLVFPASKDAVSEQYHIKPRIFGDRKRFPVRCIEQAYLFRRNTVRIIVAPVAARAISAANNRKVVGICWRCEPHLQARETTSEGRRLTQVRHLGQLSND